MPAAHWLSVGNASPEVRNLVEAFTRLPVASDACVVLMAGVDIVGWFDDYGTFHPLSDALASPKAIAQAEAFSTSACDLWETLAKQEGSSHD